MIFFSDLNVPIEAKIAIDSPVGSITDRKGSHKGSWSRLLQNQIRHLGHNCRVLANDELWFNEDGSNAYDVVILEHGMEYKGENFNLYGGWNDELQFRIGRIFKFVSNGGQIISADQPMPDFGVLYDRKDNPFTPEQTEQCKIWFHWFKGNFPWFERVFPRGSIVVGDSHALSMYVPGFEISRNDGQTLHGALKIGLENYLEDYHKRAVFYFGNIDIRHHIFRQSDPQASIEALCLEYVRQIIGLKEADPEMFIEVIDVLPIEDESRKLPKTGYYRGTPFAGSWEQRNWARQAFNYYMNYYAENTGAFTVYHHPGEFCDPDGKLSFAVMEQGSGSVHLSREFYRYDFETGLMNQNLGKDHVMKQVMKKWNKKANLTLPGTEE